MFFIDSPNLPPVVSQGPYPPGAAFGGCMTVTKSHSADGKKCLLHVGGSGMV